jgi:hypothetical protein
MCGGIIFALAVNCVVLCGIVYGWIAIYRGKVQFTRSSTLEGPKAHLAGCLCMLVAIALAVFFCCVMDFIDQ